MTLKKNCIETETKKTYERMLNKYFKKPDSGQDKSVLEVEKIVTKIVPILK